MHRLRETLCLDGDGQARAKATVAWDQVRTCLVISSCSSLGNVENVSNLVPIKKGIAVYGENVISQVCRKANMMPLPRSAYGWVMPSTNSRSRQPMHVRAERPLHDVPYRASSTPIRWYCSPSPKLRDRRRDLSAGQRKRIYLAT